jgi:hypothetical protein
MLSTNTSLDIGGGTVKGTNCAGDVGGKNFCMMDKDEERIMVATSWIRYAYRCIL